MNSINYIVDEPLPLSQDFKSLKKEGLAYIQEYSGGEWSNLNPSDPGITILDQLCFALTELGYCNDFSLCDILTGSDGELQVKDQFYLPDDILTTSPVTSDDYRKYIIDGILEVKNAIFLTSANTTTGVDFIYQVYLFIDQLLSDDEKTDTCKAAFFYLNKRRNLGEIFLMPLPLKADTFTINGSIEIENKTELTSVLVNIQDTINNYIFPEVLQTGYDQLNAKGIRTNEIFNGPLLKNGWIQTKALGQKKDHLNAIELTRLIGTVPGVSSVSGLSFGDTKAVSIELESGQGGILTIDVAGSLDKELRIYCKNINLPATSTSVTPGKNQGLEAGMQFGNSVNIHAGLPKGKFREINKYYSIQNTFPEIFAVGADAIVANASKYQMAQSRQLKGYLTLFDQVLANQFSQLANIDRLFSFKNSMTGAPSDEKEFYQVKDSYQKKHPKYPAPYRVFSPTYFYQSLYNVPHIRHLLKDNETFHFTTEIESKKTLGHDSWAAYKEDPYNPYMWGLKELIEDEKSNLLRRNDILDHLLARHGESPLLIDSIIDGSAYTKDVMKDQVIFKSLYLQNMGLLSYFRQKACNFIGANKITGKMPDVPLNFEAQIFCGDTTNFIFDSGKIDHLEKLTEPDFINYSALELKLSLLFGLKAKYRDFIADNYNNATSDENIKLAMWMIKQRRGLILVETCWLLKYFSFNIILTTNPQAGPYWHINEDLPYDLALSIAQAFSDNRNKDMVDTENGITIGGINYMLIETETGNGGDKLYQPLTDTLYSFAVKCSFTVKTKSDDGTEKFETESFEIERFDEFPIFKSDVEIIFPAFIDQSNTDEFKNRLDLFLQNTLPVQVEYECHFIGSDQLTVFIAAFVNWHNSLIYNDKKTFNY
jgi:hypothetical protein